MQTVQHRKTAGLNQDDLWSSHLYLGGTACADRKVRVTHQDFQVLMQARRRVCSLCFGMEPLSEVRVYTQLGAVDQSPISDNSLLFYQPFSGILAVGFSFFAWPCEPENNLSKHGSIVVLDLVGVEVLRFKVDSRPFITLVKWQSVLRGKWNFTDQYIGIFGWTDRDTCHPLSIRLDNKPFNASERLKGEEMGKEEKGKGLREIGSEAFAETERTAFDPAGNQTRDRSKGWCWDLRFSDRDITNHIVWNVTRSAPT